jgi:carbon-monoxide dehydrogenase small subunit
MHETSFTLNGETVTTTAHPLARLLDVLREEFGMTGVKEGCGEGECGACAVLKDGHIVNSCILSVGMVEGSSIETPEGISATDTGALISDGYAEAGAVQCGFCMTGMLVATEALLRKNPDPDEWTIRTAISGNLCRCTGYALIVDGVKRAARKRAEKPGVPQDHEARTVRAGAAGSSAPGDTT